jgi:DNA-binding CsgD family transcriptional regulator
VEGVPGIGKSRLLDAAAQRALAGGMQVLRARGGVSERDLPFGLVVQLFEHRLNTAGEPERQQLLSGAAGLAAPLFDGRPWGRSLPDDHSALASLIHGLHWLATNLATRQPLLLAVDDVHWADAASLRALVYLAQRVEELPIAIVASLRSGETTAAPPALGALARHAGARILRPEELSPRAVAALVRTAWFPAADDAFCGACAEASGGNPFLLGELLLAMRAGDVAPAAPEVRRLAPESVARAVLRRVEALSPQAAALARAAAVLGDDVRLGHAAALADIDPQTAERAAEALTGAAVLAHAEPVTFAHPVVRAAILAAVPEHARRRLHVRAAALLHAAEAPVERVAAQLLEASRAGEPWAVDVLRVAAERALARGVPETAARHLARALEEPLERDARVLTLLDLGRARLMSGDPEALAPFEEARTLGADPQVAARALLGLGEALFALGRTGDAADAFHAGLDVAGHDTQVARELRAKVVGLSVVEPGLRPEALRYATDVARLRGPLTVPDRAVLATLAVQQVFTLQPHELARDVAGRALGDGELIAAESSDGLTWMQANAVLTWSDDLVGAIAQSTAAVSDARRRGSVTGFATASYCRATPHFWSGRLDDASADAQQALDGRRFGWAMYVAPAAAVLAWSLVEQDDLDGADAALAPVLGTLDTVLPQFAAYALHARGRLHAARGDHAGALADHLAAGERLTTPNPALFPWRSAAAVAAWQLGQRDRAAELAAEETAHAERFGAPRSLGIALRAQGLVAGGEEGLGFLTRAVDVLDRSPAALERVRALTDLGAAWRDAGDQPRARDILRRALDQADRLGARAIAARARAAIVKAGARPRRAQITGLAALTPAERRTAELAAQGLSNREIAEALFVTMKTVEWHLRHAYAKLGISGRPELGPALAEG